MTRSTEDILKHAGVKGMKWGVRKSVSKGMSTIKDRVGSQIKSNKRELSWQKLDPKKMKVSDMKTISSRINMENDFKRLSSNRKISTKKDRADYRNRSSMTNEQISKKLDTLRSRDTLTRAVSEASRVQRTRGHNIAEAASGLIVNKNLNGKLKVDDYSRAIRTLRNK